MAYIRWVCLSLSDNLTVLCPRLTGKAPAPALGLAHMNSYTTMGILSTTISGRVKAAPRQFRRGLILPFPQITDLLPKGTVR